MKIRRLYLIVAFATAVLLISLPPVTAQGSGIAYQYSTGIATLTTEDVAIKTTAFYQVPHFHWWNASSPGNDYHVMFLKIMEANDTDSDGAFNPESDRLVGAPYLLPTSGWDFSGFEVVEDGSIVSEIHFNFTTTTSFIPSIIAVPIEMPESFNVTVQIRVHMDTSTPNEMKFDIIISGWKWIYDDSILVFEFTVAESPHEGDQDAVEPSSLSQEGNRFDFNEGYLEYAEQAQAGQAAVQVHGTHSQGTGEGESKSIYLAFEYFGEDTLEYDPILGIQSGEVSNGFGIDYDQLLLMTGGLSVVVLVILLIRMKRG